MGSESSIHSIEAGAMDDIDELEALYNDLNDHLASSLNYPGWRKSVYPIRETAESRIKEGTLFVLRINDRIAGSIILNHEQEDAYNQVIWEVAAEENQTIIIHTLVVHPKFMKQGVSQKLVNFAKHYAQQKSMKSIRLDVAVQNAPAISLYEKCGFKLIGTVDLGLGYDHLKWFKLYELVL